MEGILYCTLNIFCILILILIFLQIVKSKDKRASQVMYSWFIISSMILCTSDLIWGLVDFSSIWQFSPVIDFMVNSVYQTFILVSAYIWFMFSESELGTRTTTTKKGVIVSLIPLIIGLVLIVGSYWGKWVFFINDKGEYERGPLYIFYISICFFYILLTSIKAFVRSFYKANYLKRAKYRTLSYFCVFPLIAGFFQVLWVGSPMLSAGVTYAAIQVYLRSRQELISVDPLTKLNNRAEMERFIDHKMKNRSANKDLYLFIMDMDDFKKINDKFGHVEGDEALTIVANIIRDAASKMGLNAFRYGGDEFVVSGEVKHDFDPNELCTLINEALSEEAKRENKEYSLHLSIGYFKHTSEIKDITEFIAAADEYLYMRKNERNLKRAQKEQAEKLAEEMLLKVEKRAEKKAAKKAEKAEKKTVKKEEKVKKDI